MKKRFLAMFLTVGMLCNFAPMNANAEEPTEQIFGDFSYVACEDHAEITGFATEDDTHPLETVQIPAEIDGLPVTSIGEFAFWRDEFSGVILPDTLTSIGVQAFGNCQNLTEVEFPASLTSVGNGAFGSSGLKEIHIPETITDFGENIFFSCVDLETAELPDNMTVIPNGIFQKCHSLKHIDLPEHTTVIGEEAFGGCWGLENIVIPESVTTLGLCCFSSCIGLEEVTIPESVTEIGDSIFMNCTSLKRVNFSGNVKDISFGMFAFSGIEEITFSETVESVSCSLTWCRNLKSVTFLNPDCEIFDNQMSIFNEYNGKDETYHFGGIIYGYEGSTAQNYAQKYGYEFRNIGETFVSDVAGDVSGDGKLSVVDFVQFKKMLLSGQSLPKIGDMNGDNVVNVIDFALLKKALLKQ